MLPYFLNQSIDRNLPIHHPSNRPSVRQSIHLCLSVCLSDIIFFISRNQNVGEDFVSFRHCCKKKFIPLITVNLCVYECKVGTLARKPTQAIRNQSFKTGQSNNFKKVLGEGLNSQPQKSFLTLSLSLSLAV